MLGASALWNASRPAAWVQEATTGFQHLSPEFWPRGHSRPPSTRDAETGGQGVQSQPGLHSCLRRKRLVMPTVLALGQRQEARCEFEASLAHTSSSKEVRPTSKESVHTNPKGRRKRDPNSPLPRNVPAHLHPKAQSHRPALLGQNRTSDPSQDEAKASCRNGGGGGGGTWRPEAEGNSASQVECLGPPGPRSPWPLGGQAGARSGLGLLPRDGLSLPAKGSLGCLGHR